MGHILLFTMGFGIISAGVIALGISYWGWQSQKKSDALYREKQSEQQKSAQN